LIPFEPRNPDFAAVVRESFARQGAMAHLGVELAAVGPGLCELRLPFRPELSQQHGYFHGGIVAAVADSAGGYAGFSLMPAGFMVLTVEFKINLIAPATPGLLIARGRVVRPGRTLTVSAVEVAVRAADGGESPCATMLQTLMGMPAAEGRPTG
jgi:uncharacterized protein (TIGR00369 family)